MRRFLFTLTLLSVPGWSQPSAQQPAQPPIVVKVEMPPAPRRDFLGYLQALGPLIAASVAVIVGVTQWYLQTKRAKQDLFDKRFEVYKGTLDFIVTLLKAQGSHEQHGYGQFLEKTAPAEFLFRSRTVIEFLKEIGERFVRLQSTFRDLETWQRVNDTPPTVMDWPQAQHFKRSQEQLDKLRAEIDTQVIWFTQAFRTDTKQVFSPDLQFQRDKSFIRRMANQIRRWVDEEVPNKLESRYDRG
jgi:hypothetical protein